MTTSLVRPLIPITLAAVAAACDSCGCHAPPDLGDTNPQASPNNAGPLSLGLFEQYTNFSTLKTDGQKVGNPTGQWMHSSTTQLAITHRLAEPYSVGVFIPYVSRSYHRPNNGVMEDGTVAGLGDISVLGSARVVHVDHGDAAAAVTLQGGLKLPTGDAHQLKSERDGGGDEDPANAVGGHDLALGSGSWDVVVGGNAIGRLGRAYATASVMYTRHTEGAYQYLIADEVSATGSLGYYLWQSFHGHVGAQMNVIGDSKGLDRVAGQETTDTANHNLYIGPEVVGRCDRMDAMLGLDIPIIERNSDTQLVLTWRVRASLSLAF